MIEGCLRLINETVANPSPKYDFWDSGTLVEIYPNLLILPSGGKTRAATEMLEKPEFDKMLFQFKAKRGNYNYRQSSDWTFS